MKTLPRRILVLSVAAVLAACSESADSPVAPTDAELDQTDVQSEVVLENFENFAQSQRHQVPEGLVALHTPFIRIAGIGGNYGLRSANTVVSSGDVHGSVDRLSSAQFDAMSTQDLIDNYDVLLFTWASPNFNADWATRLQPFLNAGNGVIWEDPNNLGDVSAIATSTWSCSGTGSWNVSYVEGLTDGINGTFANNHFCFSSWASWLTPIFTNGPYTSGLAGEVPGGGRIVFMGPDSDYHSHRPSDQYNMLVNAILWSATSGPIQVDIDIKPGSSNNPINTKSKGVIPVAVFTTDDFDATTIDASTVAFGPGGAAEAHGRGHIEDVDGDGDDDMVLHFSTQDSGIHCGDTEASLTGQTTDGDDFEGSDTVSVKCK